MQRLFTLALVAAIFGGGYAAMNGVKPADVQRAVQTASGAIQNATNGGSVAPLPGFGGVAPPAATDSAAPGFVPAPATPTSVVRIATFNIQVFGDSKAQNANVMRTLAAIVQQFDLVAIQEIRTKDQHFIDKFLRDYVNASGRSYSRIVGPRLGRTNSKEQYAFLFNTATIQVNPNYIHTLSDEDDLLHRPPLIAMFATRHPSDPFTFILINSHTDPDETDTELDALAQAIDKVRRHAPGEDDVILLGDLNTNVPITPPVATNPFAAPARRRQIAPRDLRAIGSIPAIYPVIRDQPTNVARSKLHDNILVHRGATTEFTGNAGVFDIERLFGLSREEAKMVSDHLPVWAEFSVVEGGTPGRLASGALQRQ